MNDHSSASLAEDLTALLAATGGPPSAGTLSVLGGWDRIAEQGAATADTPVLTVLVALMARDLADPVNRTGAYSDAVRAVAAAITATESPAIFADSLNALLSCPGALAIAGPDLAESLEDIIKGFWRQLQPDARATRRAADALETLTQLNLRGIGSPFGLLATLERFNAPVPKPLGTAVIRAVGTAIDYWPHAVSLAQVVRLVAGLEKPRGPVRPDADPEGIASDAAWVLAGIELVTALRASDLAAMAKNLETSAAYLRTARDDDDREDATVLLTVVELLRALLQESGVPPTIESLSTVLLSPEALDTLAERVRKINISSVGLNHWYGGPKRAALAAWARLADDLGRLRTEFSRSSFYKAEVVVDHLLQIYMGSRSVEVVRHDDDIEGLFNVVQPIIETGFARTAGLLSNLEDHTAALEQQTAEAATEYQRLVLADQLDAARRTLGAAQAHALGGAGEGKGDGGTAVTPLPPPLDQLIPPGSDEAAELASLSPAALAKLAREVDNRTIGRRSLNLVEHELFTKIRSALVASPDYHDDVAAAVDEVLRLVIRFVTTRNNAQSDLHAYLYDPEAKEGAIHNDLYNYLSGSDLGSTVGYEVPHVGGGRIDLRLVFDRFAIYLEMKVDDTKTPLSDKTAYLKQAATYQISDVRIGFLIALRHKAFDPSGPPPHVSELIGHTTFDIQGDRTPRHIITVQVPGSRTKPSRMR
jgi:hypothetical protein